MKPMLDVASDFVSPTPHNFLKRKFEVEVLAWRFSTPEFILTHKSSCFPRAEKSSSLLETDNINQIALFTGC